MSESTKKYIVSTCVMKAGYNDLQKIKEFAGLIIQMALYGYVRRNEDGNVKKFSYK